MSRDGGRREAKDHTSREVRRTEKTFWWKRQRAAIRSGQLRRVRKHRHVGLWDRW